MAMHRAGDVPKCSLEELRALREAEGSGQKAEYVPEEDYDSEELDEVEPDAERINAALSPAHRRAALRQAMDQHLVEPKGHNFTPPKPPVPVIGLKHLTPDNLDETSVEGRIFKLERRLKRNLPNEMRRALESQLEDLQYERDHPEACESLSEACRPTSPGPCMMKSALNTGARRKVVNVMFEEPASADPDTGPGRKKTLKKVNKAAPVIQHPQTMHRMQDWKAELDRRIREQEEIDAEAGESKEGGGWLGTGGQANQILDAFKVIGSELQPDKDSPLSSLSRAVNDSFSKFTSLLGADSQGQASPAPPRHSGPLPSQTFSRRL
jgi:hypothetical protein